MNEVWTLPLDAATDPLQAGGKAATLARLRAAGIPAPDGFCITVAAFEAARRPDPAGGAPAFAMPPALAEAVTEAYRSLGGGPVAVRSSGVAEDLAGASFAGQYVTLLDVEGEEAVLAAVQQVWASAASGRAAAYAAAGGRAAGGMAVLVQRMAHPDSAGVMFTRSPEPGRAAEMVIEAAPGLGEAVVSASVTPDRYRLRRGPLRLIEAVVSQDRGPKARPVLAAARLRRLAGLGLRIEAVLGAPQDIEWAAENGQLWALQARPITAPAAPPAALAPPRTPQPPDPPDAPERPLPPLEPQARPRPGAAPPPPAPDRPADVWSRANVGEVFPGVISPLTWFALESGLRDQARELARSMKVDPASLGQMFGLFHGRVYLNVGLVHYLITDVMGLSSEHFEQSLGGPGRNEGLPLPHRPLNWRKLLRTAPAILADLRRAGGLPAEADAIIAACRAKLAGARALDLTALPAAELVALALDLSAFAQPHWMFHIRTSGTAFGAYGMLSGVLKDWCGDGSVANDLLTGLATLRTTAISEDLWRIARSAAASPQMAALIAATPAERLIATLESVPDGGAALAGLRAFLAEHGHRTNNELDLMEPRWADDPRPILAVFKGYVAAGPESDPEVFAERQRLRRLATEREVTARLSRGLEAALPLRRQVFRFLLDRAQRLLPLRENVKYELLRLTLLTRQALVQAGGRFAAAGLLTAPDDVFFLTMTELRRLALAGERAAPTLRQRVARRRSERTANLAFEAPEIIVPGQTPAAPPPQTPLPAVRGGALLTGLGASAGRATGPARVLHSPAEADQLRPGEVLVARFTDPGWTPVFPLAAAIVMDLGGLLSHGAIVAREYGIPAVVNLRTGTARIRTGQMVTVDGSRGEVLLHEDAE